MIELWLMRVLAVAALVGGAWYWADSRAVARTEAKYALIIAKATEAARIKEADWQTDVAALQEVKDDEIKTVAAARDAALASLRNRAKQRLPEAAQSSCAGASPAALDAPDASVAVGFAAEFDTLRADYAVCLGYIGKVTH